MNVRVNRVFPTYLFIIMAVLLFAEQPCFAQSKRTITLVNADVGTPATRATKNVTRLIGNVKFELDGAVMYCDSAFLNDKESFLEAFSNVKIVQGKVTITSDKLTYNGNDKIAKLRSNIVLVKEDKTLTTNFLDYNISTKIAYYYNGGKLVSTENNNTLTSTKGYYYDLTETVLFLDSVDLVNPDYNIVSDSLEYYTRTEKVRLLGKSVVTNGNNKLYSNSGWYDTKMETCYFNKRAKVVTEEQILEGDSIYFNQLTGIGKAYKNVVITDTVNDFIVQGDIAHYNEVTKEMLVTDRMLLSQINEGDTLFISGDTLRSKMMGPKADKRLFACYNNVKFFRPDLQGKCDSLVYSEIDSAMYLFQDPVLWSEKSQLSGDTMYLYMKDKKIDRLFVPTNAFIVSQEDSVSFNQIKGRMLTGFFKENRMDSMIITGNGETIYYAFEEKVDSNQVIIKNLIGVNKAECTNIAVSFRAGNISAVSFLVKPHAVMYPIGEVDKKELLFKNFTWQIDKRPKDKKSIIQD
ncbi:MAG: lipopolysaccharide export system protein LptA [Flavobacteriales bacterium]|jgi:lipopolysaccharide export system protein LptA